MKITNNNIKKNLLNSKSFNQSDINTISKYLISQRKNNNNESIKSGKGRTESINNIKYKRSQKLSRTLKLKQLKSLVFEILSKDSNKRNSQEILIVGDYLSKHYKYFINLKKNESQSKVDKLVKICKLEKFLPGNIIISYGDIADKFYIVLEGNVEIFIPEFYETELTSYEFLQILEELKFVDKLKYERIKSKNSGFTFDNIDINKIDNNSSFMKNKLSFYLEKEEKKGEYGQGFSFGEIALIKKTTRNATIKSVDNVICLSITKNEYNEAMKEIESKKLAKDIDLFKNKYQFFNPFSNEKMLKIFNCFSKIELYQGDFLFHQNDINEYIYLVVRGNFEIYSYISYSWLNEYYDYIDDSLGNILFYLISNPNLKYNELQEIIKNIKINLDKSPMKDINYSLFDDYNMSNKKNLKDNLYYIKNDEEQINNKKNIFKIDLNKVDYNDIFGLEDSFDFKRKFYSVKCVSSSAELKCIKVTDLLRIIWSSKKNDYLYILKFIMNKKNILKNKITNAVKNLEKKILFGLDMRYENLINYDENIYNKSPNNICLKEKIKNNYFHKNRDHKTEKELNQIVSAIKLKGYKTSLQDILDEKINILPQDRSSDEIKFFKNTKSINNIILKNILKNHHSNPHLFKFTKKAMKSFNSFESKNESFLSSSPTSKKFTNYTTYKNNINNFSNNNIEFSRLSNDNKNSKDEINYNYLEKSIYKLNRTNDIKESMYLIDKMIKTPNYLSFSNNNQNKKNFLYKLVKRKSRNMFHFNSVNKIPLVKYYSVDRHINQKIQDTIKTHIISQKNNLKFIKRSISINPVKYSKIIQPYESSKVKAENKMKDIVSTIRKVTLMNKVMANKTLSKNESYLKENRNSFYFDEKEKLFPINMRNNLNNKRKTFINKNINFQLGKINLQKQVRSSVFNK